MNITRKKIKVEVPNVAMGDIAFNLLVFFVILAKAQDDSHIKWTPATTPTKVERSENVRASIAVDKQNMLYLNGQQISISDLNVRLESLLRNAPPGERTVLLKISRDTLAPRFQPIIEAVSAAGGDLVHVLEEKIPN